MLVVSCGKKKVTTDPNADQAVTDTMDTATDMVDTAADTATEEDVAMDASEDEANREAAAMAQAEDDFINIDLYFDYDSSVIQDSAMGIIENKANWLLANTNVTVVIEGHCDERGTTEYNLALGDRRAARVKSTLMNLGVDSARIKTLSYGEERPIVMGHSEAAWSKNRRAHFVIK